MPLVDQELIKSRQNWNQELIQNTPNVDINCPDQKEFKQCVVGVDHPPKSTWSDRNIVVGRFKVFFLIGEGFSNWAMQGMQEAVVNSV